MPGYNNPSILELENDCLRRRLSEIKAAARDFSELVGRYVEPKKGYKGTANIRRTFELMIKKIESL